MNSRNSKTRKFNAGLINGIVQTTIFNPVDRALYLMVKHHRPFFTGSNWKNPYQGLQNAIFQRTISYGMYFPFFDFYNDIFNGNKLLAGIGVGSTTALLTNPLASVKYHHWGKKDNNLLKTAGKMLREKGISPFLKGAPTTIVRDSMFSVTYFYASDYFRPKIKGTLYDFAVDSACAMSATILGSPVNYVKNRLFMDGHHKHMTLRDITKELVENIKQQKSILDKAKFVQHRFSVGWGTARVGIGMALSRKVYEFLINE